ncbi:MAG: hypothetical protein WCT32_00590 [Patescibacteria group bacterium]
MQQKKNNQSSKKKTGDDIVHLGRGRKPYRVERGEHGEFKKVKGPAK